MAALPADPTEGTLRPSGLVNVTSSYRAGFTFLTGRFRSIFAYCWMLIVLIAIINQTIFSPAAIAAREGDWIFGLAGTVTNIALTSLLLASMLRLALEREDRLVFARLELGADELRILALSLGLYITWLMLYIGANGAGGQIIYILQNADLITKVSNPDAPGDGWLNDLQALAYVAILAPLLIALAIFAWLAVRMFLTFPVAIAERRFGLFDGLALTRGSAFRILSLYILQALTIGVIFAVLAGLLWLIGINVTGLDLAHLALGIGPEDYEDFSFNRSSQTAAWHIWVRGAYDALINLAATALFAGAAAHAYRTVRPQTEE